jgi:hypothetical protein
MTKKCIEKRLEEELKILQNKFDAGHELVLKYLPNDIRYSQNGKLLSGEVNGNIILIYDNKEDLAISTLHHEFIEYLLSPMIKDYLDIINTQNKLLTQLLIKRKEDVVERLIKSLN